MKIRVEIACQEPSPYNGQKGTIVGKQKNHDKHGVESTIYLVRLDKPHRPGFEVVGFPQEGIREIYRTYSADEYAAHPDYTGRWGR